MKSALFDNPSRTYVVGTSAYLNLVKLYFIKAISDNSFSCFGSKSVSMVFVPQPIIIISLLNYSAVQTAVEPQGSVKRLSSTGSPISSAVTFPPNFSPTVSPRIYAITDGESPVV